MIDSYSAVVSEILENWLASLAESEAEEPRLDSGLLHEIEALIEEGEIGKLGKVKSILKDSGS